MLATENGKMTRQECKERYLYNFKMTDKTESSNRSSSIEHIVIVTDSYSRINLKYKYYCNSSAVNNVFDHAKLKETVHK